MIRFWNEDELADVEAVLMSIARQRNVELRFGRRKSARSGVMSSNSLQPGVLIAERGFATRLSRQITIAK